MASTSGVIRLDRAVTGLAPSGRGLRLEPGEHRFVVMDGDTDIITLTDPQNPDALLARLPLAEADAVTWDPERTWP